MGLRIFFTSLFVVDSLFVLVLLGVMPVIISWDVKAATLPRISVASPQNVAMSSIITFNVSVWLESSDPIDVFLYQVGMFVDDSILSIDDAWVPETNSSWIFHGKSIIAGDPSLSDEDDNGLYETVELGSSLLGDDSKNVTDSVLLAIIELRVRSRGTAVLNISGTDDYGNPTTYVLDPDLTDFIINKQDGRVDIVTRAVYNHDTALSYETIQEAINANETENGHTILVDEGIYYEHVVVDKTLSIIGQDRSMTIVDGDLSGISVLIWSDNVTISGFTIQNSNTSYGAYGVEVYSSNCVISDNTVTHNQIGGVLVVGSNNSITGNILTENPEGITISFSEGNNTIIGNTIAANSHVGINITHSDNNEIFHNNLINNTIQAQMGVESTNIWDNGIEGNYWSNYNGTDLDADGIGDTYLPWEGVDNYPLVNLYWNPGDLNHDLKVNMMDVGSAARAYGTKPGDGRWNPHADITGSVYLKPDNQVDMRDIGLVARSFGETY